MYKIFHLAADGCDVQIVLELGYTSKTAVGKEDIQSAEVLSFYSSKTDLRIDRAIDMACEANKAEYSDVIHLGWDFDHQIRDFLKLPRGMQPKCNHLISYFSQRYNFKLIF